MGVCLFCNSTTGIDGLCDTAKAGDDVQVIAVNQGQPSQICVSAGPNSANDSINSGDDWNVGEDIDTGANGICDSAANNTDVMSTNIPSDAALISYLNNTAYNQAVIKWDVTRIPDCTVNFDLNKDGKLDVTYWKTTEMDEIINRCKQINFDKNIFLVDNPTWEIYGIMNFQQRYGFVFVDMHSGASQATYNTIAHELGHGIDLHHPDNDPQIGQPANASTDRKNLMHSTATNPWRLRNWQWDKIN